MSEFATSEAANSPTNTIGADPSTWTWKKAATGTMKKSGCWPISSAHSAKNPKK